MQLAVDCYRLSEAFPRDERYGLTSQLRRASLSVPSNIAEGCGRRTPKDVSRFLWIAYASAGEVGTQLEYSRRIGVGDVDALLRTEASVDEIRRMLASFIKKIEEGAT